MILPFKLYGLETYYEIYTHCQILNVMLYYIYIIIYTTHYINIIWNINNINNIILE